MFHCKKEKYFSKEPNWSQMRRHHPSW